MKLVATNLILLSTCTLPFSVAAQPIAPAADGTGTIVTPNGDRFNITGGSTSNNGTNLFHSFQKFGLDANQTANFLANPSIRNILGRVIGGEASLINGSLEVSGANANLFLMNPAGIVFGANAQLNIPASFTATNATGIGFGDNWFSATGANNYNALDGNPNSFAFTNSQPGSIINSGNLAVKQGQNLTLMGGSVIQAGTLTAPGGNITISAVSGENLVRLTQPGNLLSLEIAPVGSSAPNQWKLPAAYLPQLLTGSGGNVTVNDRGQIVPKGSDTPLPVQAGDVAVTGTLNASGNTGGTVQVLGNRVALVGDAKIDVSGKIGGGTALIGGDYQGKGTIPNATSTFVDRNTTINASALTSGNGGKVVIWANDSTRFFGNISARGGELDGNGGFVEVSGKTNLTFNGLVDVGAAIGTPGQLLLDPARVFVVSTMPGTNDSELDDGNIFLTDGSSSDFFISATKLQNALTTGNVRIDASQLIQVDAPINSNSNNGLLLRSGAVDAANNIIPGMGEIDINQPIALGGSIDMFAGNNINLGANLTTTGGAIALRTNNVNLASNITLNANNNNITIGGLQNGVDPLGNPIYAPGQMNGTYALTAIGKDITLSPIDNLTSLDFTASSTINFGGNVNTSGLLIVRNANFIFSGSPANPSNITAASFTQLAGTGDTNLRNVTAIDGSVQIQTAGNINSGLISTLTSNQPVTVTSTSGAIGLGGISTNGGKVTLTTTNRNISLGAVNTLGGNVEMTAGTGDISFAGIGDNGYAGDFKINSARNVTANSQIRANSVTQVAGTGTTSLIGVYAPNGVDITTANTQFTASQFIPTPEIITDGSPIRLNSNVQLNNDSRLNSTNGGNTAGANVTIAGTTTGDRALTVQGGTAGNVALGTVDIDKLSVDNGNSLTLNGNVETDKAIDFSAVSIINVGLPNVSVTARDSDAGNTPQAITLGTAQINGAGNTLSLNGSTMTANGPVTLGANLAIDTAAANGNITFNNTVNGGGNLTTGAGIGNIDFKQQVGDATPVGAVTINSAGNVTALGTLDAASVEQKTGAGNTDLQGVTTRNGIVSVRTNGNISTKDVATDGGNITLISSSGAIDGGNLNSSTAGNGGDVTLKTNNQNITVSTIDSQSSNGTGGAIDVSVGDILGDNTFRATGTFTDNQGVAASISSVGATGGGNVTILHGGGAATRPAAVPFKIGDASIDGTAGAINTGSSQLNSASVWTPPTPEATSTPAGSFPNSYTLGNIQLITQDSPNPPAPAPLPIPEPIPAPAPVPIPEPIPAPESIPAPVPVPAPESIPAPASVPAPESIPAPASVPMPEPIPAPVPVPAPEPIPAPAPTPISENNAETRNFASGQAIAECQHNTAWKQEKLTCRDRLVTTWRPRLLETIAAFQNTDGGTIVVAVNNQGKVYGPEGEFDDVFDSNAASFEEKVKALVGQNIGDEFVSLLRFKTKQMKGNQVVAIVVKKAPKPAFIRRDPFNAVLIVRENGKNRVLNNASTQSYIQKRW